jgi:nitroimidazol reductase NimA-like FMN-containing flavoprotein (pyridoxamine 5'-phosphate oxidase superfamily)
MNEPVELSRAKCLELISAGVVGRVALCTPSGPHIVPVNYAVVDEAIVMRTTPYSILGTLGWSSRLAFEVDHLDYERQRGWSVVAVGPGEMVEDAQALAAIRAFWDPRSWAGGHRLLYIRLPWTQLTGRRIGTNWTPEEEMPVRRTL